MILFRIYQKIQAKFERCKSFIYVFLLHSINKNISPSAYIHPSVKIYNVKNVFIGEKCFINQNVIIEARAKVIIERNVTISGDVHIITSSLIPNNSPRTHLSKPILISENTWIASRSSIIGGVSIGSNSIVALGSVVTRNVNPNSFYAGVPARFIKRI